MLGVHVIIALQGSAAAPLISETMASSERSDLPILLALGFALISFLGSQQS